MAAKAFRAAGRIFIVAGAFIDGVSIPTADRPWRRGLQVVASWEAAAMLAARFGRGGAAIGTFFEPGLIGGGVGTVVGGLVGYAAAGAATGSLYGWAEDTVFTPASETAVPPDTPDRLTMTRSITSSRGHEIDRLRVLGTEHLLIEWPLPEPASDDAIPGEHARALVKALLAVGNVAFRWDGDDQHVSATFFLEPNRSAVRRLADRLLRSDDRACFGVLVTADPTVAPRIFTWPGWSVATQAVLVHEPAADLAPIISALQHSLDWRDRPLPAGCHLLFGSGHDGGLAIASGSPVAIDRFAEALRRAGV